MDTYSSIIAEMGCSIPNMINSFHPEYKVVVERQATLEHLVRSLQRKATERQRHLVDSLLYHEYLLEAEDLEGWIGQQQQHAASTDYGQDYEHLLVRAMITADELQERTLLFQMLQERFDDFKCTVEAGSERYGQSELQANKLINSNSSYSNDIASKQTHLK